MLKACARCGKIHEQGQCTSPSLPRYERHRTSEADRFRNRKVWQRKAKEILERDYHCCRVCLSAGIINSNDLSVHHIIPLASDFDKRLDNENLVTLCRYHHEEAERGLIRRRELMKLTYKVDTDTLNTILRKV